MSNRFKIFAFVASFVALCSVQNISAQTVFNRELSQITCIGKADDNNTGLIEGGRVDENGTTVTISSSAASNRLVSITATYVDEYGVTQSLEEHIGKSNEYFIKYTLANDKYDIGTPNSRLYQLTLIHSKMPREVSGKTVTVTVNLLNTKFYVYKFDALMAPEIEDATGWDFFDGLQPEFSKAFCENDEISIAVNNGEYPYGEVATELGHKYRVTYGWSLTNDATATSSSYKSNVTSFTVSPKLTTGPSNSYVFTLSAAVYDETDRLVKTFVMGVYNVQYDAPLDVTVDAPMTVCEGDEVSVKGVVKKDGFTDDDITFRLYDITDGTEKLIDVARMPYQMEDNLEFDLGVLPVVDRKNTTYKFKAVVEDNNDWYAPSTCYTEYEFDITVVERSADITLSPVADVCEDGDVHLSATVDGTSTYTYEWEGVDCTPNFDGGSTSLTAIDKGVSYNGGTRAYRFYAINTLNTTCKVSEEIEVKTNERPVLTAIETPVEVCLGEELEIGVTSSQPDVTYTWLPDEGTTVDGSNDAKRIITGSVNKTYKVTAVNNVTGCDTKEPVSIVVNVLTQPDVVSVGNYTVCEDRSVVLSAVVSGGQAPYTFTWKWTEGGVDYVKSTTSESTTGKYEFKPTADVASATDYIITVSAVDSKNCNLGAPLDGKVTVTPTPEFTWSVEAACDGGVGTINFVDGSGFDLSYEVTSVDAPSAAVITTTGKVASITYPLQNLTEPVTYKFNVRAVDVTTCDKLEEDIEMVVYPLPTVEAAVDDDDVCLGSKIKLSATSNVADANAAYKWSVGGTEIGTGKTLTYTTVATGDIDFVVEITNKLTGCSQTDKITVKVSSPEFLEILTSGDPICEGESETLTSSLSGEGYTYAWTPKTGLSSTKVYEVVAKPSSTTEYKLVVTNKANGCKSEAKKTVQVNKLPTFTVVPDPSEVCEGTETEVSFTITQTNTGADAPTIDHYMWDGVSSTDNPYKYSEVWSADKTFTIVAVSTTNCESKPVKAVVKVNPKPEAPIVPAPADICDGKTASFAVASPNSSYKYKWYSDAECSVEVKNGTSFTSPTLSTGVVTYYVKAFLGECESDVTPVSVNVIAYPSAPEILTPSAAYCSSDALLGITLEVNSPNASLEYTWYNSVTNAKIGNGVSVVVKPSATTSYYVTAKNATGCESDHSEVVTLTINQSPVITADGYFDTSCQTTNEEMYDYGQELTVSSDNVGLQYYWNGSLTDAEGNEYGNKFMFDAKVAGENTITVKAFDGTCWSNEETFVINVTPAPAVNLTPDMSAEELCDGDEVSLSVTTDAIIPIISWYYDDNNFISTTESANFNVESGKNYNIYILDLISGCDAYKELPLHIFSNPELVFEGNSETCVGGNISYTAKPVDESSYSYKWYKGSVSESNLVSSSATLSLTGAVLADGVTYTLVVGNGHCETEVEVPITIYEEPTPVITSNDFVCYNGTIEFSTSGYKSYSWSVDGVEKSTDQVFAFDASSYSENATFEVSLLVVDNQDCSNTIPVTKTISVRELPKISKVDGVEYCFNEGANIVFTPSLSNEVSTSTYSYLFTDPKGNTYDAVNVPMNKDFAGSWTVSVVENEFGCEVADPYSFEIKIHDAEFTASDADVNTFCSGKPGEYKVEVSISSDEDVTDFKYHIEIENSSIDEDFTGVYTNASISSLSVGVHKVTVTATSKYGCKYVQDLSLEIFETPEAVLSVSNLNPCYGEEVTLTINEEKAAPKVTIYVDGVAVVENVSDLHSYTLSFEGTETHEVYVVVGNDACNMESDHVFIKHHSPIVISLASDDLHSIAPDGVLALCEGESTSIFVSSDDESSFSVSVDGGVSQTYLSSGYVVNAVVLPEGVNNMDQVLTVVGANGCTSEIIVRTARAPQPNSVVSNTDVCSEDEFTITTTGGSEYSVLIERDGVDVTSEFDQVSYVGDVFDQSYKIKFVDNGTDFNEYKFSYTIKVGTCVDFDVRTVKVYKPVETELSVSPSRLVISGTSITLSATGDYEKYEFYIDDVAQGEQLGVGNNTFVISSITADTKVSVKATSYYGCSFITEEQEIKVLEGIDVKDVVVSNDYYCSNDDGVTVSVLNPQVGITYVLNECGSCSPIKCENESTSVEWNSIKVLSGETTSTYSVTAYHEALPSETTDMANTVNVTEVYSPAKFNMSPNRVDIRCDVNEMITIDGSETGVYYALMYNGDTQIGEEKLGTGSSIDFEVVSAIGSYTVVAYSKYDGVAVCPVTMNGTYSIDVTDAIKFALSSDPVDGNYCAETDGVEIILSGSEDGYEYQLMLNGVDVEGSKVVGTGSAISFGYVTDEGEYTVMCLFNGCKSLMDGSVVVTKFEKPLEQVVEISNNGHYCAAVEGEDPVGVTITVNGQQEGYLYTLYRGDVPAVDNDGLEISHIGEAANVPFYFYNIAEEGTYSVRASIPAVSAGCESIFGNVVAVEDNLPAQIGLYIGEGDGNELTICESEETSISVYNTQSDTEYELLRDGVVYRAAQAGTVDGKPVVFDNITEKGTYTISAVRTIEADGIVINACPIVYKNEVVLNVVPRPGSGVEVVVVEEPEDKLAADPCYGKDIVVKNAQTDAVLTFTYRLYRKNAVGDYVFTDRQFVSVGDDNIDRFENIQDNNGSYLVKVSNGYCEDDVTTVDIINNKYVDIQDVVAEDHICQGDPGVTIGLAAAEVGVTYRLYDANGNMVDEYLASSTDAFVFPNYVLQSEGHYIVTGFNKLINECEIPMQPAIDFVVNPLPISYSLKGNSVYCDDVAGLEISLTGSERDVEYVLYKKNGDELVIVDTHYGSGAEFSFKPVFEGTYVAASRNVVTGCTSSMEGELSIRKMDAIVSRTDITSDIFNCTDYVLSYSDQLTSDATYYLVKDDSSIEMAESSVTSDGISAVEFILSESGKYTVYAAYGSDMSCMVVYDEINFTKKNIDESVEIKSDVKCDGTVDIIISNYDSGVNYFIDEYPYIKPSVNGSDVIFTVPSSSELSRVFTVSGKLVDCTAVVGVIPVETHPNLDTKVDDISVTSCGDPIVVTLTGDFVTDAVYYVVKEGKSPSDGNFGFSKYDGTAMSYTLTESGNYDVLASYNNDCFTKVANIHVATRTVVKYDLTGVVNCDGSAKVTFSGSQVGINYILGTEAPVAGTGSDLVWNFDKRPETDLVLYTDVCDNPVASIGRFELTSDTFKSFVFSGSIDCETNNVNLKLAGSEEDINYVLYANGTQVGDEIVGNGSSLIWSFDNIDKTTTYSVFASNGECADFQLGEFEAVVYPEIPTIGVLGGAACDNVRTIAAEDMIDGATYYLVGDGIMTMIKGGIINVPAAGNYSVVATFDGKCITTVAEFSSEAFTIGELVAEGGCEGRITVTLSSYDKDASYEITCDKEVSTVLPVEIDNSLVWNFDIVGTHIFTLTAHKSECSYTGYPMVSAYATKIQDPSEFKAIISESGVEIVSESDIPCDGQSIDLIFDKDNILPGITYEYIKVRKDGKEERLGSAHTAVGTDFVRTIVGLNQLGYYELRAFDGNCTAVIASKDLNIKGFTDFGYDVKSDVDCEGNYSAIVSITNAGAGIEYSLLTSESIVIEKLSDTSWKVNTSGSHYTIMASKEGCGKFYLDDVDVADKKFVDPTASLTLYVNGRTYSGLTAAEVHSDTDVKVVANVNSEYSGNITKYIFSVDGVEFGSDSNEFIPDLTAERGVITISVSVIVDNCRFDDLDYVELNVTETVGSEKTLDIESITNCDGTVTVIVKNPIEGYTYKLEGQDSELSLADGEVSWTIADVTEDAVLTLVSKHGRSELEYSVEIKAYVEPNVELIMLYNGDEVKTDGIEICPSSMLWFYGNVENTVVGKYTYTLNKLKKELSGELVVDSTIQVVSGKPGFIYKPTAFEKFEGDTLCVTVGIETEFGCIVDNASTRKFIVRSSVANDNRLFTIEGTNEYCEGESGLGLAYRNAEKNVTYRLWKYTNPEDIESDLDLVDIQELPFYYKGEVVDTMYFSGWSFNSPEYKDHASAGFYYVTLETAEGCAMQSNTVEIIENPAPYSDRLNIDFGDDFGPYFAVCSKDEIGNIIVEESTKNKDYGVVDVGYVIFDNALASYNYELVYNDTLVIQSRMAGTFTEGSRLFFGPISSNMYVGNDTIRGEAAYSVRVTDTKYDTQCSDMFGNIIFVDEELTTYDVFLFMNASQSSVRKKLIPAYGHKGNKKYIDWSSRVDVAYYPSIETSIGGTTEILSDPDIDMYDSGSGYSSLRGNPSKNANIRFELLDIASETILDKWEPGCISDTVRAQVFIDEKTADCDSVYMITGYSYFEYIYDRDNNVIGKRDLDERKDGCDSLANMDYRYYIIDEKVTYTRVETLRDKLRGTCGFDDYDSTTDLTWNSLTGEFVYRRAPNFFGQEVIPYRVYNESMKNVRVSNTSYITILCGNNEVGDSISTFLVPNAISPNGDGFNDEFKIILPHEYVENHTSKLEIYNRWGTLVYRSSGLQYGISCPYWDGTSSTSQMVSIGEKLPQGTYYYVYTLSFNVNNLKTKTLSGYVELRR